MKNFTKKGMWRKKSFGHFIYSGPTDRQIGIENVLEGKFGIGKEWDRIVRFVAARIRSGRVVNQKIKEERVVTITGLNVTFEIDETPHEEYARLFSDVRIWK